MRRIQGLYAVLALILASMLFVSGCNQGPRAASVNGTPITMQDLEKRIAYFELIYGHQLKGTDYQNARGQILDTMIDEQVLIQEAKKRGVKLNEKEVDKQYKEMLTYLQKDVFKGDKAKYKAGLTKAGLTEADLKDILVKMMTQRALFENVTKDVKTDNAEVKKIYDENKERFIQPERVRLLEIKVNSLAEAKKAAEALQEGKDFAEVAKQFKVKDGGDRGYVTRKGGLVQEVEDVAFSLKVGDISPIVKSHYAFHILKVTDHQAEKQFTFEEVKDDLTKQVIDAKKRQKFDEFRVDLNRKSKIIREE